MFLKSLVFLNVFISRELLVLEPIGKLLFKVDKKGTGNTSPERCSSVFTIYFEEVFSNQDLSTYLTKFM